MRPHPTLSNWYTTPEQREGHVRRLFDDSAAHYDTANAVLSFGSGRWYRRRVVGALPLAGARRVLDVAVGSGQVARALEAAIGPGGVVVGLDASFGMLAVARPGLRGPLLQGRAEALPLAAGSIDVLTMGYALRHVAELGTAFGEYLRVLRPGGALLILEIGRPEGRMAHALARFWLTKAVPALCALRMPRRQAAALLGYYWETIEHCVPPADILAQLHAAGFADVSMHTTMGLFREYSARRP